MAGKKISKCLIMLVCAGNLQKSRV